MRAQKFLRMRNRRHSAIDTAIFDMPVTESSMHNLSRSFLTSPTILRTRTVDARCNHCAPLFVLPAWARCVTSPALKDLWPNLITRPTAQKVLANPPDSHREEAAAYGRAEEECAAPPLAARRGPLFLPCESTSTLLKIERARPMSTDDDELIGLGRRPRETCARPGILVQVTILASVWSADAKLHTAE